METIPKWAFTMQMGKVALLKQFRGIKGESIVLLIVVMPTLKKAHNGDFFLFFFFFKRSKKSTTGCQSQLSSIAGRQPPSPYVTLSVTCFSTKRYLVGSLSPTKCRLGFKPETLQSWSTAPLSRNSTSE